MSYWGLNINSIRLLSFFSSHEWTRMRKWRWGLPWHLRIQPSSTPVWVLLLHSTPSQPFQLFYQHKYLTQHSAETWREKFLFSGAELHEPQHFPRNGKNIQSYVETECGISSKISVAPLPSPSTSQKSGFSFVLFCFSLVLSSNCTWLSSYAIC